MSRSYFLAYILFLCLGWMQFYSHVRETFNGISDYKAQVERLKSEARDLKIDRDLEAEHFMEFRQNIATLMPDVLKQKGMGEAGYPYRSLASTISRVEATQVKETIAKTLFETGKARFHDNEFGKANRAFQQVIDRFSYTPYVTESYFLMAEGYYQQHDYEQCTATIQQMIELFPGHELTGFAMIRLGQIYQSQNRNEEAVDIYRTVLRSFPQRDVASQAKASLKGLEL